MLEQHASGMWKGQLTCDVRGGGVGRSGSDEQVGGDWRGGSDGRGLTTGYFPSSAVVLVDTHSEWPRCPAHALTVCQLP